MREKLRTTEGGHDRIDTRARGSVTAGQTSLDIFDTECLRAVSLGRRHASIGFRVGSVGLCDFPFAVREGRDNSSVVGTALDCTATLGTAADVGSERYA